MEDEDCTEDVIALYLAFFYFGTVTFCWVSGYSPRLDWDREEE